MEKKLARQLTALLLLQLGGLQLGSLQAGWTYISGDRLVSPRSSSRTASPLRRKGCPGPGQHAGRRGLEMPLLLLLLLLGRRPRQVLLLLGVGPVLELQGPGLLLLLLLLQLEDILDRKRRGEATESEGVFGDVRRVNSSDPWLVYCRKPHVHRDTHSTDQPSREQRCVDGGLQVTSGSKRRERAGSQWKQTHMDLDQERRDHMGSDLQASGSQSLCFIVVVSEVCFILLTSPVCVCMCVCVCVCEALSLMLSSWSWVRSSSSWRSAHGSSAWSRTVLYSMFILTYLT
ncbi:hypothetical protein INR49_010435 [Caranx melampygus]|nr:hypothetical protein INR49_010435 [Caranx melampygus]